MDRKVKYPVRWKWGKVMERVKDGEYGRCIFYMCMKNRAVRPVVIVLRKVEVENDRSGESN
jgi:hypothetical protein